MALGLGGVRRLVWLPLFAVGVLAGHGAAQTAKEPESGHRYPVEVQALRKLPAPDLAAKDAEDAETKGDAGEAKKDEPEPPTLDLYGLAIREKTIFNVNVYSYVLYVDRAFTAKEFEAYRGLKLSKLEKTDALFEKLLQENATKEIRLRFCRDVDTADIVSAFDDSLRPRILERRKREKASEDEKLANLVRFRDFFDLAELKEDNELRVTWHPDGTLSTVVNGKRKPDLKAPDLAASLFDVYLGEDPVSNSGKKKLIKRLPEILAALPAKGGR